jgi:hypothetical protein
VKSIDFHAIIISQDGVSQPVRQGPLAGHEDWLGATRGLGNINLVFQNSVTKMFPVTCFEIT